MLQEFETEDELTGSHELFPELQDGPQLEDGAAELERQIRRSGASTGPARAALPGDVHGWILDTNHSAIELIGSPTLRNGFLRQIDWTQQYFPGNPDGTGRRAAGPLATELFSAMARVVPERRVPFTLRYRRDIANIVVPIPGEPRSNVPGCRPYKMLHPEASQAFVRMRAAAANDGVPLRLLPGCRTAWRSAADQAAISKSQPNPLAAAAGVGPHMYGLAIDLQLGVRGLPIREANTRGPEKMANVVRMYRSPIYKWLALYGSRFGWFPYRREPWHWEYNPPGFKERYEGDGGKNREFELEAELELSSAAGYWIRPFISSAIPTYPDGLRTACSVYVPNAAWKQPSIDLLIFFHGDPGPCATTFIPDPRNTSKKFGLDAQIDSTNRRVAVAVPVLHWIPGTDSNLQGKWTAKNLNLFVEEVLSQIGRQSGVKPRLSRLIIAGHSHAYAILTPLASEFHRGAPATQQGALAKLRQVWALDSTYGPRHVSAIDVWARNLPAGRFVAVLNKASVGNCTQSGKIKPIDCWNSYYSTRVVPKNVKMVPVSEGHCQIPSRHVRTLISTI